MQRGLVELFIFHERNIEPRFDTPFTSVESNFPTFVGRIGRERIVYHHVVSVLNLGRHFVVDIDFVAIDTTVTNITVVLLVFDVELHITFTFGDIPEVFTIAFMSASTTTLSSERAIFTIVFQRSVGKYFFRVAINPPVEQIEMMRCLMHPKWTPFVHQAVPAPEIRGSVMYV